MMPCDGFKYQHLLTFLLLWRFLGAVVPPSKHTDPFGCCYEQQESKKKAKEA